MQISIDLGSETIEAELPEVPITFSVAPGGTLYGFLEAFYPENLLSHGVLFDAHECQNLRGMHAEDWPAWSQRNYSWNMFCREVNHLPQPEAEAMAELLLSRDVTAEMRFGGLLGGKSKETFERATGLRPKTFLVTWMRIANRYAWAERVIAHGIPDPLFDPIPPIRHSGRPVVENIYKRRIQPYLKETFYARGHTHTLEVFAQAILYAFGYLPAKPASLSDELWERAVTGLFNELHVLAHMCAYPGDYFNCVAQNEQSGRAAFFPTPLEVAELMGEILGTEMVPKEAPATPEERRARLLQEVSDPAVGTGNLAWPLMNDFIRGQFIDINPEMVAATRALFAMYAPWFAGSVFCADALDAGNNQEFQAQARQYAIDAALAHAGFQSYARRKTEALMETHGIDGLMRQSQESQVLSGHIRAHAQSRRLQTGSGRFQALFSLLSQEVRVNEKSTAPEPERSKNERHTKPALPLRRPKSGLPGQISFFD